MSDFATSFSIVDRTEVGSMMDIDSKSLPSITFGPAPSQADDLLNGASLPANDSPLSDWEECEIPRVSMAMLSSQIHKYKLLEELGSGAYGTVFLAANTDDEHLVAIKVIQRSILSARMELSTVFSEKNILSMLAGERELFALQLEESFMDSMNYYLVTELATGGTLLEELNRRGGRMPFDEAKFYAAELVHALDALHKRNLLHRDIKIENIFLDSAGHIIIGDFGLARLFNDSPPVTWNGASNPAMATFLSRLNHCTRSPCGTLGFMAPEILQRFNYSYKADIYSLACTIHLMLTGMLPFDGTEDELVDKTINEPYIAPGHLDCVTRDFLTAMMEKNPAHRLDLSEAKEHPFFDGIDWNVIAERRYEAPWAQPAPRLHSNVEIHKATLLANPRGPFDIRDLAFASPVRVAPARQPPTQQAVEANVARRKLAGLNLIKRLVLGREIRERTPSPKLVPFTVDIAHPARPSLDSFEDISLSRRASTASAAYSHMDVDRPSANDFGVYGFNSSIRSVPVIDGFQVVDFAPSASGDVQPGREPVNVVSSMASGSVSQKSWPGTNAEQTTSATAFTGLNPGLNDHFGLPPPRSFAGCVDGYLSPPCLISPDRTAVDLLESKAYPLPPPTTVTGRPSGYLSPPLVSPNRTAVNSPETTPCATPTPSLKRVLKSHQPAARAKALIAANLGQLLRGWKRTSSERIDDGRTAKRRRLDLFR